MAAEGLVTGLIRHVELEDHRARRPSLREAYGVARLLTDVLRK